jgi:YVTN family beta-propeller protein
MLQSLIDSGTVLQEFDAAGSSASFNGILYSKDGSKLYASQANGRIIFADVADDGTIALDGDPMVLPQTDSNPYPGGMALSQDGKTLYVVMNRNNTLAEIDLATRMVVTEIAVGNVPYEVLIKGGKAYVSNRGGRPAEAGDFTNLASGTEIVADSYSASAITGTVSVVDLPSRQAINTIEVGLHPSAMLLDGERLFVANTKSDSVSINRNRNWICCSIVIIRLIRW